MAKMTQKELEDWADAGMEAASAESELRRAVRVMASLLARKEWAEHLSTDPDALALESAITAAISQRSTEGPRP